MPPLGAWARTTVIAVVLHTSAANAQSPTRAFRADLSASEETTVTHSDGTGIADAVLDFASSKMTWKITYTHLSSPPIAARIHGPMTAGAVAGTLIDLAPHGLKSPLEGSLTLTPSQIQYLLSGWMYVNISTVKYPKGELRGQLDVLGQSNARAVRDVAVSIAKVPDARGATQ